MYSKLWRSLCIILWHSGVNRHIALQSLRIEVKGGENEVQSKIDIPAASY
jgi:hypothetical protein